MPLCFISDKSEYSINFNFVLYRKYTRDFYFPLKRSTKCKRSIFNFQFSNNVLFLFFLFPNSVWEHKMRKKLRFEILLVTIHLQVLCIYIFIFDVFVSLYIIISSELNGFGYF